MAYSEDQIALAAEYALGTLDADERAQVETMMSADPSFTAVVQAWEFRLGVLNQMVGSVEPRPEVWEKIRSAVGLTEEPPAPAPPVLPPHDASTFTIAADSAVAPAPANPDTTSEVVRLSVRARRWRNAATMTSAVAAALVAMIGIEVYRPELLPDLLRPKARIRVVEAKNSPVATVPVAQAAQYVAILQRDGGAPAFILTVDGATKQFTVRKVGASAEPGKSFELWLISDKLPRPRSLGVIGASDFTERPVLSAYDSDIVNNATYAVTVEQAGGSPDGNPHSAPIFTGKLVEAVPPAAPPRSPAR